MIDDKDIWMDCDTVVERLKARNELLEAEADAILTAAEEKAEEAVAPKKRAKKVKN